MNVKKYLALTVIVFLTVSASFSVAEAAYTIISTSGLKSALVAFGDYFKYQKWQTIDNYVNTTGTVGEYIREESRWITVGVFSGYDEINYTGNGGELDLYSGTVQKDTRTGLWWTDLMAETGSASTTTNIFTLTGVAGQGDGTRPTGGHAINFCEALNTASFAGKNDWYLPTQKQLMQAYINGSANNLLRPNYYFWSSTEYYNSAAYAWRVALYYGNADNNSKTNRYSVRCVR